MFARISKSWDLVKASYGVLRADKELVVFPVVSMIGILIVMASFAIPMYLSGLLDALVAEETDSTRVLSFIVTFIFYVVVYTVIIFANTALVGAAMIRLRGGDPTVRDGFRIAGQHIETIIVYAVISATVGMILRVISQRGGIVGQIVASLFGLAWSLATFLVVPILVVEEVGPVEAIKRSSRLLKETWGEQVVGDLSISLIFFLISVGVILLGLPLVALAAATGLTALVVLVVAIIVAAVVAVNLVGSTLSGIYRAALYQYAKEGATSDYFDDAMIHGAFRVKN